MYIIWALAAILAGAGTAIQTGMNAQLRVSLGHSLHAALVNFILGILVLGVLIAIVQAPLPSVTNFANAPRWSYFGGFFGALFVACLAYTGRELGAAMVVALVVCGQLSASVLLDHYGALGFPVRELSWGKLLGCLLLLVGAVLIRRG